MQNENTAKLSQAYLSMGLAIIPYLACGPKCYVVKTKNCYRFRLQPISKCFMIKFEFSGVLLLSVLYITLANRLEKTKQM